LKFCFIEGHLEVPLIDNSLASFPLQKEIPLSTEYEAVWNPGQVRMLAMLEP
jgi:hypothetical protein